MKVLSKIYKKLLKLSDSPNSLYYLLGISFTESSFLPLSPDIMLFFMGISNPKKVFKYSFVATIGSVLGGILGYFLGSYFWDIMSPYIFKLGYKSSYIKVQELFFLWDFWVILVSGFLPFPYKIFTLGAGATHVNFFSFIIASIIGRGLRFYTISLLIFLNNGKIKFFLLKYINFLTRIFIIAIIVFFLYYFVF